MRVGTFKITSPNVEAHERTMQLFEEGQGRRAIMTTQNNMTCNDRDCHEIHAEVVIETVSDYP